MNFSLPHCVRTGSGARPACYLTGTGSYNSGGKTAGGEADHLSPSSAEVKTAMSPLLNTSSWRGA
jgi:hypothetical protein